MTTVSLKVLIRDRVYDILSNSNSVAAIAIDSRTPIITKQLIEGDMTNDIRLPMVAVGLPVMSERERISSRMTREIAQVPLSLYERSGHEQSTSILADEKLFLFAERIMKVLDENLYPEFADLLLFPHFVSYDQQTSQDDGDLRGMPLVVIFPLIYETGRDFTI